jgi:uncharacterized sporulation protein YeaH/YhbH (DUF444 family)
VFNRVQDITVRALLRAGDSNEFRRLCKEKPGEIDWDHQAEEINRLKRQLAIDLPQILKASFKQEIETAINQFIEKKNSLPTEDEIRLMIGRYIDVERPGIEKAVRAIGATLEQRWNAVGNAERLIGQLRAEKEALKNLHQGPGLRLRMKIEKISQWIKRIEAVEKDLRLNPKTTLDRSIIKRLKQLEVNNLIPVDLLSKRRMIEFLFELQLAGYWLISDIKKGLTNLSQKGK